MVTISTFTLYSLLLSAWTSSMQTTGCFREEVENVKIWFSSHNFMTVVGGAIKT